VKENSMRNNNLRIKERQTAHLVDPSPWPLQMAVILGTTLLGIIILIINKTSKGIIGGPGEYSQGNLVIYSLIGVILIFILWFRDILRESVYTGKSYSKSKRRNNDRISVIFTNRDIDICNNILGSIKFNNKPK